MHPLPARFWIGVTVAVARRPSLWITALVQWFRLARRGWWRRPPFLPVPDAAYVKFRLETMYGSRIDLASPAHIVDYLGWCRRFPS